jgi:uncharacterized damage-inducible protein DinB
VTVADLRALIAYDDWATERLLRAVLDLRGEQITTPAPGGSSLQGVVSHILAEAWVWLRRCRGENPAVVPAWAAGTSPQDLSTAFTEIRMDRAAFLADLDDEGLDRALTFTSLEGGVHRHTIGDMLLHSVNHSTYHRGQAALLLRAVGATPIETDFVVYRESAGWDSQSPLAQRRDLEGA